MSKLIETLTALRDGAVLTELECSLADVIASVVATGKAGKVSFVLTVKPMKGAEPHMLFLADKIDVTLPKLDRTATFFFATDDHRLSRRDPRQPEIPESRGVGGQPTKLAVMPAPNREATS